MSVPVELFGPGMSIFRLQPQSFLKLLQFLKTPFRVPKFYLLVLGDKIIMDSIQYLFGP